MQIAATERQSGDLSNPLLVVPAIPLGRAGPVNAAQSSPTPVPAPIGETENRVVGAGYRSYEDITLRRMRQVRV